MAAVLPRSFCNYSTDLKAMFYSITDLERVSDCATLKLDIVLLDVSLTVKAAPHECVIELPGQPYT